MQQPIAAATLVYTAAVCWASIEGQKSLRKQEGTALQISYIIAMIIDPCGVLAYVASTQTTCKRYPPCSIQG